MPRLDLVDLAREAAVVSTPPVPPESIEDEGWRQSELAADAEIADAYGQDHPDVFGGIWWNGARLQVGVNALVPHEAAVLAAVPHPDGVDVVRVRWTLRELAEVRARVERRLAQFPGAWRSIGDGAQRISVDLRPDAVELAAELLEVHDDVLDLRVGGRPYPRADEPSDELAPGPVATGHRPDLELRASCDQDEVVAGRDYSGQLLVRNASDAPVRAFTDQPLVAALLREDGRLAGAFTGFISGTGLLLDLAPGESLRIRFLGGTAGGARYATAPGGYDVVVVMPVCESAAGGMHRSQLVSPPVRLTVVEA